VSSQTSAGGNDAAPDAAAPDGPADANDPVLDSVMAQFEILQQDMARRRKSKER
jgi:hypothetical protein